MRLKDRLRRGKGKGSSWSGRPNRFTRNIRLEQLEERQMLSAENLFAQFVGTVEQTSDVEQIPISIAPERLGITGDEVYLGFQTHTRAGNSFDPDAVRIIGGDGAAVTPAFSRDDLAGSTDSVVIAGLSAGNYTLEVFGEVPDRSQYLVDVYLVGDVDGDHVVDSDDLDSIRGMYGSRAGDDRYQLSADANLDGRINAMDLTLARRNEVAGEPADNLLEQFDGVLRQPTDTGQISINVGMEDADEQVYFAFQTRGLGGGDLDPDALQIRDADGDIVSPQYTVADLPGTSDSVVVAALAAGDYTLEVSGDASTRSHYQVDMFLAGDVNGDHVVDRDDLSAIRDIYGSSAGDSDYQLAADANLDGRINAMDYVLARRNQIASTPTVTGGESISVETSTSKSCSLDVVTDTGWGTVYDRVTAVTPAAGYKSDAPMKFYESAIGWVQPLSSPTAPQGGVFYVPEDPYLTVAWTFRESDYGNELVVYEMDNENGGIIVGENTYYPGDEEYLAAAANRALSPTLQSPNSESRVNPDENDTLPSPSERTYEIGAGTYFSFYVVQGCYEDTSSPPNYKWFIFDDANVDEDTHFQEITSGEYYEFGATTYGVEDLSSDSTNYPNPEGYNNAWEGGGDFDDVIFTFDIAPQLDDIEETMLGYYEGDGAVEITDDLTVVDQDSTVITGATIEITGNHVSTEDVLDFDGLYNITLDDWDSDNGILTLTGNDTPEHYQTALRAVTYENTSGTPSTDTRTVSITVDDGYLDSNTVTRDIYIGPIVVTTLVDESTANGYTSLREALALADDVEGDDTIVFQDGLEGIITLGGTQLEVTSDVTIQGPGANKLTIDADTNDNGPDASDSRVFYVDSGVEATFSGLTITGGYATGTGDERDGGGIYNAGTLSLNNVVISYNEAETYGDGGGIFSGTESTLTVSNSTVSDNIAGYFGSGIYVSTGSVITVTNSSTISGNTGSAYGGGIFNAGTVTVDGSTISDNAAYAYGGGIYSSNDSTLTITNSSTISGNEVTSSHGGGIYGAGGSVITVTNSSTISGNTAGYSGGGIYGTNCEINVTNNAVISGNTADSMGGGIYGNNNDEINIINSTISNNTADHSSGVFLWAISSNSVINVVNSIISDNKTDGGIIVRAESEAQVTANITNSTVSNNSGGGIFGVGNSIINVTNSNVLGNTGSSWGGGIYGGGASTINVTNSTVSGNATDANGVGGGIYSRNIVNIDESTVTCNTAHEGGGIYIYSGGEVTATNSLIALNEAPTDNNIHGTLEPESADNLLDDNLAGEIRQSVGISESGILLLEHVTGAESLTLDSNVVTTLEGLQNATSLETLRIVPADFSAAAGALTDTDPLDQLADLANLESLTLQRTGLTNADFANINSATEFQALESLDLTYNAITAVPSSIADLPELTQLSLYENPLVTSWYTEIEGKPINIDIPSDHPENAQTIEDLAEALYYNPIEMYEWVVNNIEFQPYAGSMKGPLATLQTRAGSSWDTASLLAALYEEAGITTKYVAAGDYTTASHIYVPVEEAMDYLGVTTPKAALYVLFAAGLNPIPYPNVDNIQTLYFDHAWIEADFTDTLGDWVELDPSWKFCEHRDELLDMRDYVSFDTDPATGDYFDTPTTQLTSEYYEADVRDYLAENMPGMTIADVAYNGPIIAQNFDALPEELPWSIYGSATDTLTIRDDEVANRLEISIWNEAETVCYVSSDDWAQGGEDHVLVSDVCLSSLAINPFVYDTGIRPTLLQDWDWGNEIQSTTTLNATTNIVIKIDHYEPGDSSPQALYSKSYTRKAGDYVVINLDANQISKELVQDAWRDLNDSTVYLTSQSSPDSYLDDYDEMDDHIGQLLQLVGLKFFYDTDEGEELICDLTGGIQQFDRVASGITTSSTTWQDWWDSESNYYDTVNYWDLPIPYLPEELKIDVANGWWFATSIDKDSTTYPDADEEYRNDMLGLVNSAMEHAIWEELTNIDTISTVKSLQLAREDAGNEIFEIDDTNDSTLIPQLNWGDYTTSIRNSVQAAVNDGYTVWIPKLNTDLGSWTGGGYIIKKNSGGVISIGYIISGALGEYEGGYTTGIPSIVDPKIDIWVPDSLSQTRLSDPINPANGNVYHDETDLVIPNLGTPLEFSRHYKSTQTVSGLEWAEEPWSDRGMSEGWSFSYSDCLMPVDDAYPNDDQYWFTGDGDRLLFEGSQGSGWTPPDAMFGTLTYSSPYYTWEDTAGNKVIFNSSKKLYRKLDRYGNGIQVNYSGSNISTVQSVVDGTATSARQLTFTYTSDLITRITDQSGRYWDYGYDGNGRLASMTTKILESPLTEAVVEYTYYTDDARLGLLKTVTDPVDGVTTFTYYANRRGFEVEDALGNSDTFTYNIFRDRTAFTDKSGETTYYTHDDEENIGCVTEVLYPNRTTVETTWDAYQKDSITDQYGQTETYQNSTTHGKVTQYTDHLGHVTVYNYDTSANFYNLISVEDQGDPEDSNDSRTTYYYYGDETPTADHRTLDRIVDPLGNVTAYTYPTTDNHGLPLTITRPKGTETTGDSDDYVTRFEYNAAGQITDKHTYLEPGVWVTESYTYNANGRGTMETSTDRYYTDDNGDPIGAAGNVTNYTCDLLGRKIEEQLPDPDGDGPLSRPTTEYEYDAIGNLIERTEVIAGEDDLVTVYEYDAMGRLIETENTDGTVATKQYDADGRVMATTDALGRVTEYRYDERGRRIATILPDGNILHTAYDGGGRVITKTDALGNVAEYRYDELGRKIEEILPDPDGGTNRLHKFFRYDAFGNLVSTREPHPGAYDDANAYLPDGLIGRWMLDDASGTTANSAKESDGTTDVGPDGTLYNMGASSWVEGVYNGALEFVAQDTDSERVTITGLSDYASGTGAKNTLSFWMKWDGVTAAVVTPVKWGDYVSLVFDEGQELFGFRTSSSDVLGIDFAELKGRWVHVAAVFCQSASANDYSLYINGELQSLTSYGTLVARSVSSTLTLGNATTSSKFGGLLDDVQVYNRELTADEVASLACTTRYEYDTLGRMVTMIESPVTLPNDEVCYPTTTYYYDAHGNLTGTVDSLWNSGEYGTGVTTDGSLAVHLKLDDGSGSTADDETDNGSDGELKSSGTLPSWVTGHSGDTSDKSLDFSSGTDQRVVVTDAAINEETGGKNTVSFWMKWSGTDGQMPFAWGTVDTHYDLFFCGGYFGFNTAQANCLGVETTGWADEWIHVTAVFNNGLVSASTCKLYINGELQTLVDSGAPTYPTTASRNAVDSFCLSGWTDDSSTSYRFDGCLDDLQIYDRELTPEEVAALARDEKLCVHYEYDALDRKVAEIQSAMTSPDGEVCCPTTSYYYDANGNMTSMIDARRNAGEYLTEPSTDSGLVGHWKLDDGDGLTVTSGTVGLPDAAIINTSDTTGIPQWQEGLHGQALRFSEGTLPSFDPHATVAASDIDINDVSGGHNTVSFWMKWDGDNAEVPFRWGGEYYGLQLLGGGIGFYTYTDGVVDTLVTPMLDLSGKWVHIAAVFVNGTPTGGANANCKIYVNGVSQTLSLYGTAGMTPKDATTSVEFGGPQDWINYTRYEGLLDDVQIYNRELTADEVQALLDTEKSTYWKYDNLGRVIEEVQSAVVTADGTVARPTTRYRYDAYGNLAATSNARGSAGEFNVVESLADDLVAYWKLDESSGTTLANEVEDSPAATITQDEGSPALTPGLFNNGLSSNGSDGYASTSSEIPDLNTTSDEHNTVSFWMKWDGSNADMPFCWVTGTDKFDLELTSSGNIGFNTFSSDFLGSETDPVSSNEWVHITAVFVNGTPSNSNCKIYVNGESVSLVQSGTPASRSATSATRVQFGGLNGVGAMYQFNGLLDDLQIYNRELTADEVASLYESQWTTQYAYDKRGRVTSVQNAEGGLTEKEYDAVGNTVTTFDALGNVSWFEYDSRNRLVRETLPDPDGYGSQSAPATQYEYDANGNILSVTDALENTTYYRYDDLGRQTYIINANYEGTYDPDDPVSTYTGYLTTTLYDDLGNVVEVTNALGDTTTYEYDSHSRLIEETLPDPDDGGPLTSPVSTYAYDAVGNLVAETDALEQTTNYEYDSHGLLIKEILPDPDNPVGSNRPTTYYGYDTAGNLIAVTDALGSVLGDPDHTTYYRYDVLGRQTHIIDALCSDPTATDPDHTVVTAYDVAGNVGSVIDQLGRTTDYEYDKLGRLTEEILPDPDTMGGTNRPTTQYEYDSNGNLLSVTDALENTTYYRYDALGRQTHVIDALCSDPTITNPDHTVVTAYDAVGNVTSVTDQLGRTTDYEYDNLGQLTKEILPDPDDPQGDNRPTTYYEYDAVGSLTEMIAAGDSTLHMSGCIWKRIDFDYTVTADTIIEFDFRCTEEGEIHAIGLDSQYASANATRSMKVYGTQTWGEDAYDDYEASAPGWKHYTIPLGQYYTGEMYYLFFASDDDAANAAESYFRNVQVYEDGQTPAAPINFSEYTLDYYAETPGSGAEVVVEGDATYYRYDALGRQTHVIDALCTDPTATNPDYAVVTDYNAVGNVTKVTDAEGNETEYDYDRLNRLIEETDPLDNTTEYDYDALGRLVKKTDREGRIIAYAYDAVGRLAEERWYDDETDFGNDDRVQTITRFYDAADQLIGVDDPAALYQYEYDNLGRVIETRMAPGDVTQESSSSSAVDMSSPSGNEDWDGDGANENYVEWTDSWTADDTVLVRITDSDFDSVLIVDSPSSVRTIDTGSGADGNRYLLINVDETGTWKVRVTSRENNSTGTCNIVVLNDANPFVSNELVQFDFDYDDVGNLTQVTDTLGGQIDYDYNALGMLNWVKQSISGTTDYNKKVAFTYNDDGSLDTLTRYTGAAYDNLRGSSEYDYDRLGQLVDLAHRDDSGDLLVDYDWLYDLAGRITDMDADYVDVSIDDVDSDFGYDNTNQLTSAEHDAADQTDEDYTYDAAGNRTNTGYSTGTGNQLESDGVYTYEYDDEGNRELRYVDEDTSGTLNAGDTLITTYNWDHRNRLVAVTSYDTYSDYYGEDPDQIVEFTYDYQDRRIAKLLDSDGDESVDDYYYNVHLGDELYLDIVDPDGLDTGSNEQLDHRYLYGQAVDQILAVETYDEYGDPDDILWALEDHQGTVRDIVDDADPTAIAEHRKFDSFGNMSDNTLDMPQAYTGRIWDADVELYDYRARWYDAGVGRFVNEDPSGFNGGDVNLYRYCNNSPVINVDPYGLCWAGIGNIQTTFNHGGYTTGTPNYVPDKSSSWDWINSYSTPSYSTPSYSTPSYSTPSYSTPSYSTPSYSTPSYSTPSYTTPTYDYSFNDVADSIINDAINELYSPSYYDYSYNDVLDYTQDWSSSIYTPAYTPSYSDPFANLSYSQQTNAPGFQNEPIQSWNDYNNMSADQRIYANTIPLTAERQLRSLDTIPSIQPGNTNSPAIIRDWSLNLLEATPLVNQFYRTDTYSSEIRKDIRANLKNYKQNLVNDFNSLLASNPPKISGGITSQQRVDIANSLANSYIQAVDNTLQRFPGARPETGYRASYQSVENCPVCEDWANAIGYQMSQNKYATGKNAVIKIVGPTLFKGNTTTELNHNVTLIVPKGYSVTNSNSNKTRNNAPFTILDPWSTITPKTYRLNQVPYDIGGGGPAYDDPWIGQHWK